MAEMTKDEKVNKIKEIRKNLENEEKIQYKHKASLNDYNELIALQKIAEWIKDGKQLELEQLDVRSKVLKVVYDDCSIINPEKESHKEFIKEYEENKEENNEEDKNILLMKTAFGKKYAKQLSYDYDASLISSYIFCKTIDIPEPGKWQIDSIKGYEYKIRKGNWFYMRGDTMTTWLTSLNQCFDLLGIKGSPEKGEKRIEYLCNPDNYDNEIKGVCKMVEGFLGAVYKIGNFCSVPKGFNGARSNFGIYDYWDLTLMKIREWYIDKDDKHLNELLHIKTECPRNTESRNNCKEWLEWFEKDAEKKREEDQERYKDYDGWHNFVKTLHMQDYVYCKDNKNSKYKVNNDDEKSYEVIPFWPGHEWDEGTVKVKFPTDEDEKEKNKKIKEAFKTMTAMINARTKRIAEVLVNAKK